MTHSYQTAELYTPRTQSFDNSLTHIFQVEITDFDNEEYVLEIEADTYSQASEKAADAYNGDIYMMNIYQMS